MKRQRNNLLIRENLARQEINHPVYDQTTNDNKHSNNIYDAYTIQTKFRQSMPDLQNFQVSQLFLTFYIYCYIILHNSNFDF